MENYPLILLPMTKKHSECFMKTTYFKPTFQVSKCTNEQQLFLTRFNFQHFQTNHQEIEQLAKLLLEYPN